MYEIPASTWRVLLVCEYARGYGVQQTQGLRVVIHWGVLGIVSYNMQLTASPLSNTRSQTLTCVTTNSAERGLGFRV